MELATATLNIVPSGKPKPRLWRDVLPEGQAPGTTSRPMTLERFNRWLSRHGFAGRLAPESGTLMELFLGTGGGEPVVYARLRLCANDTPGMRGVIVNEASSDIEFETVVIPFDISEED